MHHFRIILFCLLWPFCTVDTMASSMKGDVNDDEVVDVADVMLIIRIILKEDVDIDDSTPPTDGGDAIPGYPVLAPRHP